MSDRKVTVRVDVSATGNLGTVLKQHAVDAQKLKAVVGAPVNIGASGARVPSQSVGQDQSDAGIRSQIQAGQERAAQRRQQQFIRQQFAQVPIDYRVQAATAHESLGQIASQRSKLGTAPHMAALAKQDTQQEQSAILASETKRFASQFKLADLKSTQGRADEVAVIQASIKARWADAAAMREETKIRNTVEYGRVGGALATFGGRIEKAGMIASIGFAAMTGAVAAASPAAFQTLTGSIQLAVGELGISFIPTIIRVSGFFQDLAVVIRRVNDATGGWIGNIVGTGLALGTLGFAVSKVGIFLLPLFSFGKWVTGFVLAGTGASTGLGSVAASATQASVALRGLGGSAMGGIGGGGSAGGWGATLLGLGKYIPHLIIATAAISALTHLAQGNVAAAGQAAIGPTPVGNAAASAGFAAGQAPGGTVMNSLFNQLFGGAAAAPTAISANFQGQSMGLGEVGQVAQHESIRDQQQQQIFDLQIRGLIEALNQNTAAVQGQPVAAQGGIGAAVAAWQVNN